MDSFDQNFDATKKTSNNDQTLEADEKSVQIMPGENSEVFDSTEFRALGW